MILIQQSIASRLWWQSRQFVSAAQDAVDAQVRQACEQGRDTVQRSPTLAVVWTREQQERGTRGGQSPKPAAAAGEVRHRQIRDRSALVVKLFYIDGLHAHSQMRSGNMTSVLRIRST